MRWYVLHTLSGYEEKVAKALHHMIENDQFDSSVEEVVIPTEKKLENVRGKKKTTDKKIYPGYVLVRMNLTNKNRFLLRQVQGVIGFIGSANAPQPLTEEEANDIFTRMRNETPEVETTYQIGDTVKVLSGPFSERLGKVKEIENERQKVKMMINIFGRDTLVELDFDQVEVFDAELEKERQPE